MILYHATRESFEAFNHNASGLGTHLGTIRAAAQRAAMLSRVRPGEWRILKVEAQLRNPLRLRDQGAWDSEADVEAAMIAARAMSPADLLTSRRLAGNPFWAWARQKIESLGHDSVIYANELEDRGRDSWIAWKGVKIIESERSSSASG